MDSNRRKTIQKLAISPFLFSGSYLNEPLKKSSVGSRVQYSVNAYSFNKQLRSGEMTFYDMMEFAAGIGLNAVDLTGYYFSSYPAIPPNSELFQLKQRALELGLNLSWTGVRNDFVNPDPESRKADTQIIREWLTVSSKLGASIMRIFSGTHQHDGYSRDEVKQWLVEDFRKCSRYAEETGVMLGLQNHHDFLFTSNEIIDILERVNSKWFGLILDIGSLHADDPYAEIKRLAPYANYWFIKEFVYPGGQRTQVDMKKIAAIIKEDGYSGYIAFENLSDGNPKEVVAKMHEAFRNEFERT